MFFALPDKDSQAAMADLYPVTKPHLADLYWSLDMVCAIAPTLKARPIAIASTPLLNLFTLVPLFVDFQRRSVRVLRRLPPDSPASGEKSIALRDAVFDPHAIPHPNIGVAGLHQRLVGAIVHADREFVGIGLLLVSLFQRISGIGTTGSAENGRGRVAIA